MAVKQSAKRRIKLPLKSSKAKKKAKQRAKAELPSVWQLTGRAYQMVADNWKVFGVITLVYGLLFVLLVRSAPSLSINESRELISDLLGPETSGAIETFTVAGVVLASAGQGGEAGQTIYGTLLLLIFSLVIIWTLRRIYSQKKFKLREAFYRSQTPLIPFLLLLFLVALQLVPFGLGGMIYAIAQGNNIIVSAWETILFVGIWLGLALLSGWWLANSMMSLYAVTLPGMYPIEALRSTAEVTKGKRWLILRKMVFLAALVGAVFVLTLLFVITLAPWLNFWPIDLFGVLMLPLVHAYMYQLYRSLI